MSIQEKLVLDAREAVAQAERLEQQLKTAVQVDPSAVKGVEQSLRDAQRAAARLADETNLISAAAKAGEADYKGVAAALGVSEDQARGLARQVLESQAASVKLDQSTRELAQSLGLSERQARDLASQLGRAATQTEQIGVAASGVDKLRGTIGRLGATALAAFGVQGAFRAIGDTVSDFAAFDDALNQSLAIVQDVTPAIRAQFEEVARTVGEDTRFSATEAAEGFFFLASAGLDAAAQLKALPAVAAFAQAGMFDLATATELVASAQSAIGLSSTDAEENLTNLIRVADVLVQANNLAQGSTREFAEALSNRAAAAARAVGVSLEETVAVLAILAAQGIKGARAGEAYTIVLRDLQRAALDQPQAWRDLGIAVFDATGEFRPLPDIVGEMERAFDGLSDAQLRTTVTGLGLQDESLSNIQALLGFSGALGEMTSGLFDASRASEELAERQLLSLSGRLELAKGQIDDARLSIGEALVPAIEGIARQAPLASEALEDLAPSITGIATAAGETASSPGMTKLLQILVDLPRGFGQLVDIVKVLVSTPIDFLDALGVAGAELLKGDLEGARDALAGMNDAAAEFTQSTSKRIITQRLIDDLRAGTDATLAFANALAGNVPGLGRSVIDDEFIASLRAIAGVDVNQTARALAQVRDSAQRLGLTSREVEALEDALDSLSTEAQNARDAQREAGAAATGTGTAMGAAAGPIDDMASSLAGASSVASGAGGVFFTLGEAFDAAAEGVAVSAASVRDSLDLFSGGVERLDTTAAEVVQNLRDQVTEAASFEANIVFLIAAGFDDLAAELLERGPAAARAASDFVANMSRAAEAEGLLEGQGTAAAQAVVDQLTAALTSGTITRQAADAFAVLLGEFSSPQVAQAVLAAFPTEPIAEAGAEAGASYVAELAETLQAEGVSASIASALAESLGSRAVADAAGAAAFVPGESYVAELAERLAGEGMSGAAASSLAGALAADAVQEAARGAGEKGGSAYVAGLLARLEQDRESIGSALGGSFGATAAIGSAEDAGARAAQAWIQGARGPKGFKFGSPSKIAVDIGRQLAADLSGAFSSNLALNVPAPTVNNNLSFSFASGQDAGRAAAIAGQVTGLLGVVRR